MPDGNQLQRQYEQIVGPGFEQIDPTLQAMFKNIQNTVATPDVDAARNLCEASLWDTMDLDKVIIACIFTFIKSFCPSGDSSEKFQTFMKNLEWKLPSVVFDWKASPPPPPPLTKHGPLAMVANEDPEGMAIAEDKLNDFFPSLEYVMSKSIGSQVGTDNLRFGPKYFVSKHEATVAFLATVCTTFHTHTLHIR